MKSLFNKALFREQLKRFWSLSAFSFLFYLLFIIVPGFNYYLFKNYSSYSSLSGLSIENPIIIINALFFPIVIVPRIFSYLFCPEESITVLSYPIKRDSLWFTNMLAGFVIIIAPLLITYISSSILFLFSSDSYSSINNSNFIGKSDIEIYLISKSKGLIYSVLQLLLTTLIFAFNYAVCLLAAHISGTAIIYALLAFCLPLIPTGIALVGAQLAQYYTFGIEFNGEMLGKVFNYTNPIFAALDEYGSHFMEKDLNMIIYFIIVFIATLFLFYVSFFANRIRKQENTGDSVVFKALKNILIFIISLFGMFLGANFFALLYRNSLGIYIGIAVGFIISYYIAQMITEKSFNIFKKATLELYKFCGCAILVFAVILLITKFDILGFQRFTPNPNDVDSVSFSSDPNYLSIDGKYLKYSTTDERIIRDTVVTHKNIMQHKSEIRTYLFNTTYDYSLYFEDYYITYKLKNGRLIRRKYNLTYDLANETGLNSILHNEIVIFAKYPYIKSPETIKYIDIEYFKNTNQETKTAIINDSDKTKSFVSKLKQDIISYETRNFDSDRQDEESEGYFYFRFYTNEALEQVNLKVNTNTIKWLKQNGYDDLFK